MEGEGGAYGRPLMTLRIRQNIEQGEQGEQVALPHDVCHIKILNLLYWTVN